MHGLFMNKIVYGLYFTACSSPVVLPLLILWGIFRDNEVAKYVFVPLGILSLIWIGIAVPMLASSAAWARIELGGDFWDGASFAWTRLRQAVACTPIVGRYFEKPKDDTDSDNKQQSR